MPIHTPSSTTGRSGREHDRTAPRSRAARLARASFALAFLAFSGAASLVSACGDDECMPDQCLDMVDFQTCEVCTENQCTVTAKSTKGEEIAACTYSGGGSGTSQKNACYNEVHSAAESWCVMQST
jgi:hypothetical protein